MSKPVKGYKVFDKDLKCLGFQFEVGRSYEVDGPLKMCKHGFHFHENPSHLFNYYSNSSDNRVCEVVAHEVITDTDKSVCRRIEVIRELTFIEVCNLIGNGYGDGDGYGNGNGDGYGNGNGIGFGDGDGYGNGNGNGIGFGDGYSYGDGNGYGDGDGDGNGFGFGDGDGFDVGDGFGRYYQLPGFISFEEAA